MSANLDLGSMTVQGAQESLALVGVASKGNEEVADGLGGVLQKFGESAARCASWLRESNMAQAEATRLGEISIDGNPETCAELQALMDAVEHDSTRKAIRSAFRLAYISARNDK